MKQLFAIAYMKGEDLDFAYMHADSCRHAEASFRATASKAIISKRIRVVSVGPAVGAHALDDNGDRLVL